MEAACRQKCVDFMKIHSHQSAAFFARQLVCLSDHPDDVQLLAEAYIALHEYKKHWR